MSEDILDPRQRRFVEKPRIARLATINRDGTPHVAPVWYRYAEGAFLVLTERGSQKHRNIERDARVTLCIDDERPPYHTVLARCAVSVEEAPGAAWRTDLAIHYLGEENGRRYIAESMNPDDVMLRIRPLRVSGW
ncbi:MAG: PPOX class F420-dependent oxidoreductase [Chloroflexi bacterium]|nr:PPOX class F420-dependent oxidoreductase [Chloroflexota bacterium]